MAQAEADQQQESQQQSTGDDTGAKSQPKGEQSSAQNGKAPSMGFTILRDAALIFALLTLWGAGDAWSQTSGLVIAEFVALGNAAFIGLILAAIWHEWGHYLGTRFAGGKAKLMAPRGLSLLRFDFDYEENDRRQFHWMTYGGWIAQWGLVVLLLILIPMDSSNRVALVSAAVAFAVFANAIEIPVIMESRRGTDPQEALRLHVDRQAFWRCGIIGGVTGLFVFALIT